LADRLKSLPQVDALALVDADGGLVNTSRQWPAPDTSFADSDFIEYFRLHSDPGSFLAAPVKNPASGSWTMSVARRLKGPNGECLGAVVATIRTEDLEAFYKGIALQENGSVMVQRRDGTILARHPHNEKVMGRKMPAESPWYRLVESGGTFFSPGYI